MGKKKKVDQQETPEQPQGARLLVGVFLNPGGGIDCAWGNGVEPVVILCEAIKLLHLRAMQQKKSPILRAGGPLPPIPRSD